MTIPKWLLPVLAGITAIAVGTASAIIAFALVGGGTAAEPVAEHTETVPIIAPVSYGDEAPPLDLDGDPETDDVSSYLGTATVPALEPDSDDVVDAETLAAIDTLMAADDPASLPGIVTLFDGGDPCALADAASESCPEGVRSRVLSLTGIPPLYMWATTSPEVEHSADRTLLTCDPLELAEGEARFAVGTNVPASITITYWPMGNPDDSRELTLETPESQVALFEADPPREGEPFTALKHCVVLSGLESATRYQVEVTAESAAGERAQSNHYIALDVDLSRPPARIVPLAENVVVVSAIHQYGESVLVRGGLLRDGDPADCASLDWLRPLTYVTEPTTSRASSEWVQRNGYSPWYSERTSGALFVPEGRNVLICLSIYDDSRPSWNWEIADYTYSAVVQAPDVTIPRITWTGASVREPSGITRVEVVLSARGSSHTCPIRSLTTPIDADAFGPEGGVVLCDGFPFDGSAFVNSGNFIVRASARIDGEYQRTSAGLPLSRDRCVGYCETLPETTYYSISLPIVEVPSGLCGSSFGADCDPPTSAVSGGTIQLRVDWEHGARNGAESWSTSPIIEAEGVPETFDEPQFDTTAVPRYINDSRGRRVEFDLRSDRPVSYRATLIGDCLLPETVTVVEGRWENLLDSRVSFANPCRGTTYWILVELVDDEGRSAAYGPHTSGSIWWHPLDIPGTTARFDLAFRLTSLDDDGRATSLVAPVSAYVGDHRVYIASVDCFFGSDIGDQGGSSFSGWELPDVVPITVTMTVRDGLGLDMDTDEDGFPDCDTSVPGGDTITAEASVLLSELRSTGRYEVTVETDRWRLLVAIAIRR